MRISRAAAAGFAVLALYTSAPAQSIPGGSSPRDVAGFGRALAISNNDLLVGESGNQSKPGFVYVYRKSGGKWSEQSKLQASDGTPSDGFGAAVSVNGDQMVVTASRANGNKGAAYVFQRDGKGAWTETGKLTADQVVGDGFGASAFIAGDVAVVGASTQSKQTGAAYVFHRTASGWTQEAKLMSPEPKEQMFFGGAVAIAFDRILVSETRVNENTGTVRIFTKDGNEWKATGTLQPNGLQKNDRFGAPIFTDGNRLLIAATGFSGNSGAVYVFTPQTAGQWIESGRYLAFDGHASDQFGSSIAADGDEVFIGAPRASSLRGAVYHIWRNPADTLLTNAERMPAGELKVQSFLGNAVAVKGNLAAATIANADYGLGSVVVYEKNGGKWSMTTSLTASEDRIPTVAGKKTDCTNGKAAGFECSNVQLMSYMSVPDVGGGRGVQLSGIWGWTDPETGKEWALVGRIDGTSFVDLSNPEKPRYVGNLPLTKGANPAIWREIKTYKNHAYIVSDGAGAHGMQVFDLTHLRDVKNVPVTFDADFTYRKFGSAHNIVINEESGYAYATGANSGGESCGGGLHMMDIHDPKNPQFLGCFADPQTGRANTGYTHDALCVMYHGPDTKYSGHEICIGSNETMISIADVTDKKAPKALARASYPNVGYSHQGWFDTEQRYFYMNDELDELAGTTNKTRTIVWDLGKLDDPQVATMFLSPGSASDHNLFIKGDTMYQSHYVAGVRVVDIKNRTAPVEVGYFDTVPYGENKPGFGGSWSNYPFFKSGIIIATSMNEGLFVLKKQDPKPVF